MLFFLSQRVERIRQAVNLDAGVILAHHTKKLGKKQFEEDRSRYWPARETCAATTRPECCCSGPTRVETTRQLIFELRNGAGIPQRHVDKINGEWRGVDANDRLVMKDYGERLMPSVAASATRSFGDLVRGGWQRRCYTANQFAESFEGKGGLGGERTIRERVSALLDPVTSSISRNAADYGLPSSGRTKFGYLCVEGMVCYACQRAMPDTATGELPMREHTVLPTHYKLPAFRASMPVEEPRRVGVPRRTERPGGP